MINRGKYSVLGINVDAVDYDSAVTTIVDCARKRNPCAVSATAVHGIMTGVLDPSHGRRLNSLDLIVPDGQPVRWALRWLHGQRLADRVYGPELTLRVAEACAAEGLSIYFYGSRSEVLELFINRLCAKLPNLRIAGAEPSKFRNLEEAERIELIDRIRSSNASVVFVGLGCPRQEVWAYQYRESLGIPILAVGAAFDFHAGTLPQAPSWMQRVGLEWLFRLVQEPRRLWKRYVLLNPLFVYYLVRERLGGRRFVAAHPFESDQIESYG